MPKARIFILFIFMDATELHQNEQFIHWIRTVDGFFFVITSAGDVFKRNRTKFVELILMCNRLSVKKGRNSVAKYEFHTQHLFGLTKILPKEIKNL